MKTHTRVLIAVAAIAIPVLLRAQSVQYPVELIPPGKGPFTFPAGYQTPWDKVEIKVTAKMSPNLFVLHGSEGLDPAHPDGSGGRAMVLFGPDGVLMVDTENRQVAEKTLAAIRSFTDGPLKVLVNTHVHPDHTGANAFFARQGAIIFAQENLRLEMLRPAARGAAPPASPNAAGGGAGRGTAAPPAAAGTPPAAGRGGAQAPAAQDLAAIPVATYEYDPREPGKPAVTFNMNGEIVDFIPMMPSHTAGDTIVRFRNANVIYIEDFYRNFGYPFADQGNGGSIKGMIEAVDLFDRVAGPDTLLIPGHGTFIKKKDLQPYRAMLVDIMAKVGALRSQGKKLRDVLAANLTAPYDTTTQGDTQQSKDRFITEVYDELGTFPPVVNGRRTMPTGAER